MVGGRKERERTKQDGQDGKIQMSGSVTGTGLLVVCTCICHKCRPSFASLVTGLLFELYLRRDYKSVLYDLNKL